MQCAVCLGLLYGQGRVCFEAALRNAIAIRWIQLAFHTSWTDGQGVIHATAPQPETCRSSRRRERFRDAKFGRLPSGVFAVFSFYSFLGLLYLHVERK